MGFGVAMAGPFSATHDAIFDNSSSICWAEYVAWRIETRPCEPLEPLIGATGKLGVELERDILSGCLNVSTFCEAKSTRISQFAGRCAFRRECRSAARVRRVCGASDVCGERRAGVWGGVTAANRWLRQPPRRLRLTTAEYYFTATTVREGTGDSTVDMAQLRRPRRLYGRVASTGYGHYASTATLPPRPHGTHQVIPVDVAQSERHDGAGKDKVHPPVRYRDIHFVEAGEHCHIRV